MKNKVRSATIWDRVYRVLATIYDAACTDENPDLHEYNLRLVCVNVLANHEDSSFENPSYD